MRLVAFILQLLCIFTGGGGLVVTYLKDGNAGFVLLTAGAMIFALAEKIHRIQDKRRPKGYYFKWLKRKY